METYLLNPEEQEYTIYSIDDNDSNMPMSLSKGPYFELLEQIPITELIQRRESEKFQRQYEKERLAREASGLEPVSEYPSGGLMSGFTMAPVTLGTLRTMMPRPQSPVLQQSFSASPRQSPPLNLLNSPPSPVYRQELGLTDTFDQQPPPQTVSNPQELYIREWRISRAVELYPRQFYGGRERAENECEWALKAGPDNNNFFSDRELYLCNPGNILSEYTGLYRISKSFTRITRRVAIDNGLRENLYSGGQLIGTFERPASIKGIPGQFDFLPGDIQVKIASYLEPDDLIMFCNVNIKNRRLCQNPERSVWKSKLLQLNPNTYTDRISDPFHYFLRYYYGGQVLTFGGNRYGQLGREVRDPVTMEKLRIGSIALGDTQTPYQQRSPEVKHNYGEVDLQPRIIESDKNIVDVSCGEGDTVVVLRDGTVRGFGVAQDGRRGSSVGSPQGVISNITLAMKVSCGNDHTAVLLRDGRVLTFGSNAFGKLGRDRSQLPEHNTGYNAQFDRSPQFSRVAQSIGSEGQMTTVEDPQRIPEDPNPLEVPGITSAVAIACGYYHTVILLSNGRVVTFGNNASGQLGRETPKVSIVQTYSQKTEIVSYSKTPVVLATIETAFQIGAGADHTVVVLRDGRVVSFGGNKYGQLGRSTPILPQEQSWYEADYAPGETPEVVKEFGTAVDVSCGRYFTAVLLKDGRVATFGNNEKGQLGRVNPKESYARTIMTPAPIPKLLSAVSISCGATSLGITLKNGSVAIYGQLVDMSSYNDPRMAIAEMAKPKMIRGVNTAIGVAVGTDHAAVLVMNKGW